MVWYRTVVQYGTVWHAVMQYDTSPRLVVFDYMMVPYSICDDAAAWHGVMLFDTAALYSIVQYGLIE